MTDARARVQCLPDGVASAPPSCAVVIRIRKGDLRSTLNILPLDWKRQHCVSVDRLYFYTVALPIETALYIVGGLRAAIAHWLYLVGTD